jgi:hypothetical protein
MTEKPLAGWFGRTAQPPSPRLENGAQLEDVQKAAGIATHLRPHTEQQAMTRVTECPILHHMRQLAMGHLRKRDRTAIQQIDLG